MVKFITGSNQIMFVKFYNPPPTSPTRIGLKYLFREVVDYLKSVNSDMDRNFEVGFFYSFLTDMTSERFNKVSINIFLIISTV